MLTIKRVKKTNVYDLFVGNGWSHHSRVALQNGYVKLIGGKKLLPVQIAEFVKTVKGA